MVLEVVKLVLLLSAMALLGHLGGPLLACGAVGVAMAGHALASLLVVNRIDQVPLLPIVASAARVILACAPMVLAVVGVRAAMDHAGLHTPAVHMAVELGVGAIAYVASALVFARGLALEFLRLLGDIVKRRRG
jgi:hypothetical protein